MNINISSSGALLTFHMLHGCTWLVATTLDSTEHFHHCREFCTLNYTVMKEAFLGHGELGEYQ